jgi:hypothetical protein
MWVVFPTPFVEEAVFPPVYVFVTLVKNQMTVAVWIYSGSTVLFYWSMSLFLHPVPCCFCYYGSVVYFEIRYCDTSSIALFAPIFSF